MDLKLKEKRFIVSGGAKGIGADIMHRLAEEGAVAIGIGRSPEEGKKLVEAIIHSGGQAEFRQVEMTDESAVKASVEDIMTQHGRIDGVINNAGCK